MSVDRALHVFSECRFQSLALRSHVPHCSGTVVLLHVTIADTVSNF